MLIIIISRSDSKLGHVGSKTRSLGQILEKSCVHSRRHSFDPSFMKLCQNVSHHSIWVKFKTGSFRSKTRSHLTFPFNNFFFISIDLAAFVSCTVPFKSQSLRNSGLLTRYQYRKLF